MKTETIILSIHPRHIEKILSGEKRYEFRKRIPLEIRYIVVYATAPIKKIVAFIEIDKIIKNTPEIVWKKTKKHAGISEDYFLRYFKDKQVAYAVKVKRVTKLKNPVLLIRLNYNYAPQSYVYINKSVEELKYLLCIS